LLLVVLCIWALALPHSSFVDLDTWVTVFENHAPVCGAFFAVFGEFGFVRALYREGAILMLAITEWLLAQFGKLTR
jgi:hypothetical protein